MGRKLHCAVKVLNHIHVLKINIITNETFSVHNMCTLSPPLLDNPNSSAFPSLMSSPHFPGLSSQARVSPQCWPPADPCRIARCSWILSRLFPHVSQIFLHTLLKTREFDLLATLETLVNMAQQGNLVQYQGIFPSYPGTFSE